MESNSQKEIARFLELVIITSIVIMGTSFACAYYDIAKSVGLILFCTSGISCPLGLGMALTSEKSKKQETIGIVLIVISMVTLYWTVMMFLADMSMR